MERIVIEGDDGKASAVHVEQAVETPLQVA